GYFIISAAAGLFVYPNKGPVAANYGLDTIRFLRPLYHNDTIYVRLTCKEKVDRDVANAEHPSGIVKWHVEVFDANFEDRPDSQKGPKDSPLVAVATILTMVQKKQETFVDITRDVLEASLNKLSEDTKPLWGTMSPQHMLEHLEYSTRISSGEIQDIVIATPEKILEKVHATLYNYKKMPQNFGAPERLESELKQLKHENLETAKVRLLEAYDDFIAYFKEHPDAKLTNIVFGELNRYEWNLFHRKHYNHHFEQFGLL
ncbi:MAG: phenylacetic acid degradation bifunctional protein PaaZ, partial [Psychroserpens sp.]|nr:phenylacetic acid degradation bifunctional protein PaaZ [Psychroserpens sp.]